MREIKFRAWDKEKETMMTGTNQYGCDEPNLGGGCYSAGSFTRLWEALARFRESDRFILMQYTGLKDKDGKEIYEGDTVYATTRSEQFETKFAIIRWSDYLKCLVVYSKDTDIDDCLPIGRFYEFEVIGNIYENPEFLKGK